MGRENEIYYGYLSWFSVIVLKFFNWFLKFSIVFVFFLEKIRK